jgi:hypothetical protein
MLRLSFQTIGLFQFLYMMFVCLTCCQSQTNKDKTVMQTKNLPKLDSILHKKEALADSLEWKKLDTPETGMNTYYKYYDINGDNIKDSLIQASWMGSGASGCSYYVKNGSNQKTLEYHEEYNYALLKHFFQYPKLYENEENKVFWDALKTNVFQPIGVPDFSLQWVIEGTLSNKILSNHPYFLQSFRFQPRFRKGEFQFPASYYIRVEGDTLRKLSEIKFSKDFIQPPKSDMVTYIRYNGGILYRLNEKIKEANRNATLDDYKKKFFADSSQKYKIYTLPHGVIAQKGDAYAWMFITDYDLTDSPDKLRWNSISSAKLIDKYLIIPQYLGYNRAFGYMNLYIVDIEKGLCVKVGKNNDYLHLKGFEMGDKQLELIFWDTKTNQTYNNHIPLEDLWKAMDNLKP